MGHEDQYRRFHVVADGVRILNAAFSYEESVSEFASYKGWVAFYAKQDAGAKALRIA
ncbi:MAG: DUF427 domain-containing protein [Myxococcota bacterium]